MQLSKHLFAGLLSLLVLTSCGSEKSAETAQPSIPKLVVFITIDEWRGDLPIRFQKHYRHGLKTFTDNSIWFTDAIVDHAVTATGPGHLTLLSGRHHGSMGILANNFYDKALKRTVYCAEDEGAKILGEDEPGGSYKNIEGSSLGDWMKTTRSESKVFSVSGKDRAAILAAGREADGVYWYQWNTGKFITSTYYTEAYPEYIQAFNDSDYPAQYINEKWIKSQPDSFYEAVTQTPDDYLFERDLSRRTADTETDPHLHHPSFPHEIAAGKTGLSKSYYEGFGFMPWLDEITLKLAATIAKEEKLGQDDTPDLLIVSLSAHDVIFHCTGPESHEEAEVEMTLDNYLAQFMTALETNVPKQDILYVLAADHGGMSLPEYLQEKGIDAHRRGVQAKIFRDSLKTAILNRCQTSDSLFLAFQTLDIYWNDVFAEAHGIQKSAADQFIRQEALKQDWIAAVYSREQLDDYTHLDSLGMLVAHSWNTRKGADWVIVQAEYNYLSSLPKGTGHGAPYYYDMHVPWLMMGTGLKPQSIRQKVRTIDIAPTLAEILKVTPPNHLDGKSVLSLVRN